MRRELIREAVLPISLVLLIVLAGYTAFIYFRRHNTAAAIRMSIQPPAGSVIQSFAVSPDGRFLAFTANSQGKFLLWLRTIDSLTPQLIPGTDGAAYPFWSPDGKSIAFFTPGKLKRIDVSGGPAQIICDVADGRGGTWNSEDVIVFAQGRPAPLCKVNASGGAPVPVTAVALGRNEAAHVFPQFLPDGRHFLFFSAGDPAIQVGSVDSMESHFVVNADAPAVYLPAAQGTSGWLLFGEHGALISQAFDARTLELRSNRSVVAPAIPSAFGWLNAAGSFHGTLAYRSGSGKEKQLTWYDRVGKALETVGARNSFYLWSLAPDGQRLAMEDEDPAYGTGPLSTMELPQASPLRVATNAGRTFSPVWAPDGMAILFSRETREGMNLESVNFEQQAGRVLVRSSGPLFPTDWSVDGKFVSYFTGSRDLTQFKLWVAALPAWAQEMRPRPFSTGTSKETSGAFSPTLSNEGPRWIAYTSDESGRPEVYVRSFPAGDRKWQVSTHGGWMPHWRHDGRELFFLAPEGTLMAVEIGGESDFTAGMPQELFRTNISTPDYPDIPLDSYAVSRDGQRFLINEVVDDAGAKPITIINDSELRRKP